jgi:hypothetical protein
LQRLGRGGRATVTGSPALTEQRADSDSSKLTRANCPGDPSVSALNWDAERHCPQSATGRLQASNAQTQRIALFKKNSTLRFAFKPINKPLPYKIRKGKLLTFGDRERAARKPEHGRTQLASQDTSSSQRARKLPADRAAAATR